jgi:hypothetical protein
LIKLVCQSTFRRIDLEFFGSKIQEKVVPLNKVYVFRYISNSLSIVFGSSIRGTQSASPSFIPLAGNVPYFLLLFFQAANVGEVPDKLFKIKKQSNVYKN